MVTSSQPPRDPVLKWFLIACAALFLLFAATVGLLAWKYSPLLKVDEAGKRITLLGGLIELDIGQQKVKVGSKTYEGPPSSELSGSSVLTNPALHRVRLLFVNGGAKLSTSEDRTMRWSCKYPHQGNGRKASADPKPSELVLDLEGVQGAQCVVSTPPGVSVVVRGVNGVLSVDRPAGPLDIELANGQVLFKPDAKREYLFDIDIKNGVAHGFKSGSSFSSKAVPVRIRMANGAVVRGP